MKARFGLIRVLCPISSALSYKVRLKNSPYFCVFKYEQAVTQKVWNEAENRERDWFFFSRLTRPLYRFLY